MPDSSLDIPISIPGETPKELPVDPTVKHVLDQTFAKSHQVGMQAADRHSAANDNVGEQTRILFLEEKMKVGTREAAAMQRMDSDKLAEKILAQRSASVQPAVAGTLKPPGT